MKKEFFIIIIIILIILFYLNSIHHTSELPNIYKLFNINKDYKLTFLTFGGPSDNYHKRVKELTSQANTFNLFDNIIGYTEKDLKNDKNFWNRHGNFLENNKRGYGYWLWKSYIILKTLNNINENDIILYCDAGCHLKLNNKYKLLEYIDILNKSQYGIMSFQMNYIEKHWNKGDVLKYFNDNYQNIDIEKIKNSGQNHATFMLIKKNKHSVILINKWYELCSNYHFIDDSLSIEKNDIFFIDHRHDQSIFSLLVKVYGSEIISNTNPVIKDSKDIGDNKYIIIVGIIFLLIFLIIKNINKNYYIK